MVMSVIVALGFATCLGLVGAYNSTIKVGVILKAGDETRQRIVQNVFAHKFGSGTQFTRYEIHQEEVLLEDTLHYHQAVCKLLNKGVGAFLSPTSPESYPILSSYSNEYNISLVSPDLFVAPDDPSAPDLVTVFSIGICPIATRPVLDLVRDFRWQELVYFYDKNHGPESLQIMFRVGYLTLNIKLRGFFCVSNAQEAVLELQRYRGTQIQVILNTDPQLALEILQLQLHSGGLGKKNCHFLLTQPALPSFWNFPDLKALKMTGFLAISSNQVGKDGEWKRLLSNHEPFPNEEPKESDYYYHDAALFLSEAVWKVSEMHSRSRFTTQLGSPMQNSDCFSQPPDGRLAQILKKIHIDDGLTGRLEFPILSGKRLNLNLTVVQSSSNGFKEYGIWSNEGNVGGIRKVTNERRLLEELSLPRVSRPLLKVVTIISPPYMMWKKSSNVSELTGNDRFEGFCKDMLTSICLEHNLDFELYLVEDGEYGRFDNARQRWTGIVGEVLSSKADLAVGDLVISPRRQKVIEFTDPFELVSLSLLIKNPDSVRATRSMFFAFSAFSPGVWVCLLVSALLFVVLFHVTSIFTGAPDSIESASGIWGRKNVITMNIWFAIGTSMMLSTGVYPRSISSRILSCSWWMVCSVFSCLFIASITAQLLANITGEKSIQLTQLKSLSLESILREATEKRWPEVGVVTTETSQRFIQSTGLPFYSDYLAYLRNNPGMKVSNREEGIRRVRESDGNYILITDSTGSDYASRRLPCDLLSTQDPYTFSSYGFGFSPSLDPILVKNISRSVAIMQESGFLSLLHRKWWIESSECKRPVIQPDHHGNFRSFSGLYCILLVGIVVIFVVFAIQYYQKRQDKEIRRQQLTFEDLNLDNQLPTPPPELLAQPPPVLNVPEIENPSYRTRTESESFREFFEKMREEK